MPGVDGGRDRNATKSEVLSVGMTVESRMQFAREEHDTSF